jgi:hypothetical protein
LRITKLGTRPKDNCGFEKTEGKDSTVGAAFSRDLAISTILTI